MTGLKVGDRQRIWRGLMRYWSNIWEAVGVSKAELQTTVNETDAWINSNQASYNSALTYGGEFTAVQKTMIFCAVALMRVDPGSPSADLLRRALGVEVD